MENASLVVFRAGSVDLEYSGPVCVKHSTYIMSFNFPTTLEGRSYYYSHLTDNEIKAQRGEAVSPHSIAVRRY